MMELHRKEKEEEIYKWREKDMSWMKSLAFI